MGTEPDSVASSANEVSVAAASGALGFIVGGPVGGVIGTMAPSTAKLLGRILDRAVAQRLQRVNALLEFAAKLTRDTSVDGLLSSFDDDATAEALFQLLNAALESDEELSAAFAQLVAGVSANRQSVNLDRINLLAKSLTGLTRTQLAIIEHIYENGGKATATSIAAACGTQEFELRFSVRDLELRGLIKDRDVHPIEWGLRELGFGIAKIIFSNDSHEEGST